MNEIRRVRIDCERKLLAEIRERIDSIRDDEDRALRGDPIMEHGSEDASDYLSEASLVLLIAIDKLGRAKKR